MSKISSNSDQARTIIFWFGVASFLVLVTISNTVTTHFSYVVVSYARIFFCACVALSILLIFLSCGVNLRQVVAVNLFLLLTIIMVFLAVLNSIEHIDVVSLSVDVAVILAGVFFVFMSNRWPWPKGLASWFVFYSLAVFIFTVISRGITFVPLPQFNFEYGSTLIGREENYSLGVSNFYGFASVAAMVIVTTTASMFKKLFFSLCCMAFFVLCFVGGGRGEIGIAFLVISLIVMANDKTKFIKILLVVFLFIFVFSLLSLELSLHITALERFRILLEGDFSSRDVLMLDAINLIRENPHCLIGGCGFTFFQNFYSYETGLYPHNSFVEAVITFGLPITLLALIAYLRGILLYYNARSGFDMFLAFSVFASLVSLKSQPLYGSWIFLVSLFYFCWVGLSGNTIAQHRLCRRTYIYRNMSINIDQAKR